MVEKGATLRVLGFPYDVLNFTGDLANFLTGEPCASIVFTPSTLACGSVFERPVHYRDERRRVTGRPDHHMWTSSDV